MAIVELERTKAAIAASDLREVTELAAVLKARLEALGVLPEEFLSGEFGPAPMPGEPITWAEIEKDLAAHDAGEKGFTLEEMRSFAHQSVPDLDR